MRGETRRAGPCSELQTGKFKRKKAKPNQLKVTRETSAKVSKGVKSRLKDIALAE